MTKIEQVAEEAAALSDDQLEATLEFIRALKRGPFYPSAPPEALASINRGLAEAKRGETFAFAEVDARLSAAAKSERK